MIQKKIRYRLLRFTGIAVLTVSLSVLAGWYFDIPTLRSLLPQYPDMKPNTAVAFLLVAASFLLLSAGGRRKRYAATVLGLIICVIGTLSLSEYLIGSDIGIDGLLLPQSFDRFEGRMSPHSAVSFILIGLAIGLLNGSPRRQQIGEYLTLAAALPAFAALLGYLYGADQLYGVGRYNSLAIHGALTFLLCCFGLLVAGRNMMSVKLVTSRSQGGAIARRLLPTVIIVPILVAWVRLAGQQMGLYDTGFGVTLSIFCCIVLMLAVVAFVAGQIHDTDRRRIIAETDLARKERQYHEMFDHSQGMICIHDLDGTIKKLNPSTYRALGFEAEEMVGRRLSDFMPEEARPELDVYLRQVRHEGLASGNLWLVAKDGSPLIWRYHNILISEPGADCYVLGYAQDVTQLMDAQKQLKNLSLTDEMTGLLNRRGFITMAEQQIKLERHAGTARGLTLMFADMDGLKKINDLYGHKAGSEAIVALSHILKAALRSSDLVARWGGDEFVILTIGSADSDAETIFDRINAEIDEFNLISQRPYSIGCSIGLKPMELDRNTSLESLIAEADKAMYDAKRKRKAARDQIDQSMSERFMLDVPQAGSAPRPN